MSDGIGGGTGDFGLTEAEMAIAEAAKGQQVADIETGVLGHPGPGEGFGGPAGNVAADFGGEAEGEGFGGGGGGTLGEVIQQQAPEIPKPEKESKAITKEKSRKKRRRPTLLEAEEGLISSVPSFGRSLLR
ncbi:MAG: hypothetical protein FJ115_05385 [Deltaproteobacteria bacterium]|nr:hypothetical protein [Deltaproteobacteria bacterium]